MATYVPFVKPYLEGWENGESGNTPITAEILNNNYDAFLLGLNTWAAGTISDANYVHTDNNYTSTEKDKLSGIEAGANNYSLPTASTNTLGGVKVDGTSITISDGVISSTGGGSASALDDLTDVDITSVADGEVLKYNSITSKWENSASSGSGHTIVNDAGTSLAQEDSLQFKGVYSHDDSTNDKTVVEVSRQMTRAQFNLLSDAEKKGLIQITDDEEADVIYANGVFIDTDNVIYQETINSGSITVSSYEYTATSDCIIKWILNTPDDSQTTKVLIDNAEIFRIQNTPDDELFASSFAVKKGQTIKFDNIGTYTYIVVYGIQSGSTTQAVPDYSTTEHKIGRKWIDGKDIYEKTYSFSAVTCSEDDWTTLISDISGLHVDTLVNAYTKTDSKSVSNFLYTIDSNAFKVYTFVTIGIINATLQYTKSS